MIFYPPLGLIAVPSFTAPAADLKLSKPLQLKVGSINHCDHATVEDTPRGLARRTMTVFQRRTVERYAGCARIAPATRAGFGITLHQRTIADAVVGVNK